MNNRRRKTRKSNIIIESISNKNFIIISIILLIIIVVCIGISVYLNIKENEKVAEEQRRVAKQVEDIYTSVEANLEASGNFKSDSIIRIAALGDILLGSNLKNFGKDENGLYNNLFSDISKYLKDVDFVVGTYEHNIEEDNKVFANAVKEAGVNFVTLAHNHALDNGIEGLNSTKEYLDSIGIDTMGIYSEESKDRVKIKEEKGTKIAFLSYTYDNGDIGINIYNEELVKQDLEYAKENANFIVVLVHWGDVNKNEENGMQEAQAKFLIDNGADVIIGAHPSAIQPMKIIQNSEGEDCFVAYSVRRFHIRF